MKQIKFILLITVVAIFASCNNDDDPEMNEFQSIKTVDATASIGKISFDEVSSSKSKNAFSSKVFGSDIQSIDIKSYRFVNSTWVEVTVSDYRGYPGFSNPRNVPYATTADMPKNLSTKGRFSFRGKTANGEDSYYSVVEVDLTNADDGIEIPVTMVETKSEMSIDVTDLVAINSRRYVFDYSFTKKAIDYEKCNTDLPVINGIENPVYHYIVGGELVVGQLIVDGSSVTLNGVSVLDPAEIIIASYLGNGVPEGVTWNISVSEGGIESFNASTTKNWIEVGKTHKIKVKNNIDANAMISLVDNEEVVVDWDVFGASSNKTYIPDDNFEQALIDLGYDDVLDDYALTASIETIQELYLIEKGILDATGIEGFIGLTTLYMTYNQLASIDVSQNTLLTYLYLSGNQLTSIDISQNIQLIELQLDYNQLTSIDVSLHTQLTQIVLGSNQLTLIDVSQNPSLTYLDLNQNQLTSINVLQNPLLTELQIESNQLTSIDVTQNILLGTFHLPGNNLTSIDVSQNTQLTYLELASNQITSIDVTQNIQMSYLNMGYNQLTSSNVSQNILLIDLNLLGNELLGCIQVNQSQLDNIPINWHKDITANYSIACN